MATPEKPDFEAMYHELAEQMREVELDRDQLRRQLAFAQGDTGMCGVVDGDLLADILADSTPDEWRMDAARAYAERVLTAMHGNGFVIIRGPQHEQWVPTLRRAA